MLQTNLKDPVNHSSWSERSWMSLLTSFAPVVFLEVKKTPDKMHYSWTKMGFNSLPSTSKSLGMKGFNRF